MKVNPNRELPGTAPLPASPKRPSSATSSVDQPDFSGAEKLKTALERTDLVRPSAVSKARRLIADPNYPDAKAIEAVAARLAASSKLK